MVTKGYAKVYIYAWGTIIIWASAYVFTKVALTYFNASSIGVLRYLAASIFLIVIALINKIGFPRLRDIPKFFLSGAMGFTMYMITFNYGARYLSASTSSIIIATAPIITALLARIFLKEKIRIIGWIAVAIEFGGILVLMLWDGVFSINIGIIWTLGAALSISIYNLIQRNLTKEYSALQTVTYSIFAGAILLSVFLPQAIPQLVAAPPKQIAVIIFLGVFPGAIAYVLWSKALSIAAKTSDVTNYMFITPLIATLMGYLVILEIPALSTIVAGSIIIIGLILFQTFNRGGSTYQEKALYREM